MLRSSKDPTASHAPLHRGHLLLSCAGVGLHSPGTEVPSQVARAVSNKRTRISPQILWYRLYLAKNGETWIQTYCSRCSPTLGSLES